MDRESCNPIRNKVLEYIASFLSVPGSDCKLKSGREIE